MNGERHSARRELLDQVVEELTHEQMQQRFAFARDGLLYDNSVKYGQLLTQLREAFEATNTTDPTPANWVRAIEFTMFKCRRCAGTGQFITRVENGIPKGPGGQCFRCAGKGIQGHEDGWRNWGHDMHYVPPGV